MRRHAPLLVLLLVLLTAAAPVNAQSLYVKHGERAVEASLGWSVGPSSTGAEAFVSASLDGRLDVGLTIARYTYTFDGGTSTFKEYAPFVRFFPIKEQDNGTPISLAISGQVFLDDYGTDDSGRYVQVGTAIYKHFRLSDRFSVQPFIGFGFVAESYAFGGAPAERAQYLTRELGLHFATATDRPWFLRMTLSEQSFRQETYRGARVAVVRRLGN